MRFFTKGYRVFTLALLPLDIGGHDNVSKDLKTYKSFENRDTSETGWERVKRMVQLDELGAISPEANSIYQAGFLGFFVGAVYGGVIHSRIAYLDFVENNQATAFKSHLDAKRKLQDQFTVSFAKGAFKWGWRIGLFTTCYTGIITFISVYREKSSIYEYLAAGSITGALYKISLGMRGMVVGGALGGILGGIAGGVSLLLLKLSGTSMEEVRYWQYKWKEQRDTTIRGAFKTQKDPEPELLKLHDERVGAENISLDDIK